MAQRRTTQPLNYLRINKDGLLYKKSDEATYNESKALGQTHIHKSVSKDGKQTYYHDVFTGGTEEGYLEFLGIKDFEFEGKKVKQLVISVKGEEETDVINFPLYNTTGGLNLYVKHLACILPNLDFSRKINIVPSTKKNDRGYVIQNVFINYVDDDTNSFVE
ncbi:MAG: hypothetical protein KC414_13890, partial [Romboutsia sp.]|nr:hypothetical protein [Romboutsia sp.]